MCVWVDDSVLCCVVFETEGWTWKMDEMKTFTVGLICGLASVGIIDVTIGWQQVSDFVQYRRQI